MRASCRSTARLRADDVLDLLKFLTHLAFAGTIFLCSVALTYLMTRFVRVMDMPNPRSSHSRPVPKSGGIAFVATFVIGSVIIYFAAEVARIDDRDAFRERMPFGTSVQYPRALTQQPAYRQFVRDACPEAESWAAECVSLPCFPEMTDDEIEIVCRALR